MKKIRKNTKQKTNKFAIVSLILGIASLSMAFIPVILFTLYKMGLREGLSFYPYLILGLSLFPALAAILFGSIGFVRTYFDSSLKGKWKCVISIILGIVTISVFFLFLIWVGKSM